MHWYPLPLQVYGYVDEEDPSDGVPVYALVMPRLRHSLRDALDAEGAAAGPLGSLPQQLAVIADLAAAMAFVHAEGVVHGDLKVRRRIGG